MNRFIGIINLLLLSFCSVCYGAATYNVADFGAKGDGMHIDSPAINAAIEKAASDGGGLVVLPAGTYLSYSIHLRSNVTLRWEKGAVLKAAPTTETTEYDEAEPNSSTYQDFGHSHWHNSLIWGENLHDVTLEGEGLIDGTDVLSRWGPGHNDKGLPPANKALAMKDSQRVTIKDLSFKECGHFALLLTGVDDLLIDGVTADTNRDAFDIDPRKTSRDLLQHVSRPDSPPMTREQ